MTKPLSTCILIPVYNDQHAVQLLQKQIYEVLTKELLSNLTLLIVDDGSTSDLQLTKHPEFGKIEIVRLTRNMGHQKAIAIGLSHVAKINSFDYVIVMDGDGEDKPEHIANLLAEAKINKDTIIFAQRTHRHESRVFLFFYRFYKLLFRLFTGYTIGFGNFSVIPASLLRRLVYLPEVWNHYSGAVITSKQKHMSIPLDRGSRIAGESKMSFSALILHGLTAISVHIEMVAVRMLMLSLALLVAAVVAIIVVSLIRVFTDLAIAGWATSTMIGLFIVLIQSVLLSLFLVFTVLGYRNHAPIIPIFEYKNYIENIEIIDG